MKNIHLIMPFSRHHLKETLENAYRPMDIMWHPILFEDEARVSVFNEPWIEPVIIPEPAPPPDFISVGALKINHFIKTSLMINEDYYCIPSDDDMYQTGVFDRVKEFDDDVVIISMKRGHNIPEGVPQEKRYPTCPLLAHPDNVREGMISGEQYFVKGRIFKRLKFEPVQNSDGQVAEYLKANYKIRYEPYLYAMFNYYEPGRWNKKDPDISFGVMVNDLQRLDMCLKQSEIDGDMHYIKEPESATKGLNKLLDIIEAEGAKIAVLTHQDMHYRAGWIDQVKSQIDLLPDNWVVAGIIGKDDQGRICGKFHDMRIAPHFNTAKIHTFPYPVCCFDECCIIVNMRSGFRFDETMEGFDLYGTLCVLQAWEMGGTAWVIDAFAEHYCMRPFTWMPDKLFISNYKWLWERFSARWRVDSTAIGLPEETVNRIAFMTSAQ